MQQHESKLPPKCIYPQSNAMARDVQTEIDAIAANQGQCASIYLPTAPGMSEGGEDHYQGLARTHKLSDGSIYFFLSHSDVDSGYGSLVQYRYDGPTDHEHVLQTTPLSFGSLEQLLLLDEQHPSDIVFLPDVDNLDAGYLFVTEEYDHRRLTVYRWQPGHDLVVQGHLFAGFPSGGPQFVFIDRVDNHYYLGVASEHWGWGQLFRARDERLFSKCARGSLTVSAFKPHGVFPFPPIGGPSQTKLIRDGDGNWFLLAFISEPNDDQNGTDYIDLYAVRFDPFAISYRLSRTHIAFTAGDTGFANTGTHYVEPSGRLLITSSYRWDEMLGFPPPPPYFACRIDELPS